MRFATAGLALALLAGCGDEPPGFTEGGTRSLLFDTQNIELLAGFGEHTELEVRHDHWANPDRESLAVPLFRSARMRWTVGERATVRSEVARMQVGPEGDASPCRVSLVPVYDGVPEDELIAGRLATLGGARTVFVDVPALEAMPDLPAYRAVTPREGPAVALSLALPAGATAVDIVVHSDAGAPAGAYVALIGAHVETPTREVAPDEKPMVYARERRLAPTDDDTPVVFGERLTGDPASPVVSTLEVPRVREEGAFTGRDGRHAVALAAPAGVDGKPGPATVASHVVEVGEWDQLVSAVALDDRLAPGSRAEVSVQIDGKPLGEPLVVDSQAWTPVRWDLTGLAGERTISLSVRALDVPAMQVVKLEPDFRAGVEVHVGYDGQRAVRVGFARPRIETEVVRMPRRASLERPSVVVVHIETLRGDVLSGFGGAADELVPNLVRLAGRGTTWSSAVAPSPWTLPSTATLLTGLPPDAHGVIDHDKAVLPDDAPTLAERARKAGVVTHAVVTNDLLKPAAGFARGFQNYAYVPLANARQVGALAKELLAGHAGEQQLLFLHYWDPHHPFTAPDAWRDRFVEPELRSLDMFAATTRIAELLKVGAPPAPDDPDVRFLRQRYLGDVAYLDGRLGDLAADIEALGLAETTTLVVTADHGEEFLEHGLLGHGSSLHDETTRVPLIVVPAGGLVGWNDRVDPPGRGEVERRVTSTSGVHAQILDWLDVPYEADAILPSLDVVAAQARTWAVVTTAKGLALDGKGDMLRRPLKAVRSDTHLFILRDIVEGETGEPTACLYDLASDPLARVPLPAEGEEAEWHHAKLLEALGWAKDHKARAPGAGGDSDRLQALIELGYTGAVGSMSVGGCE